MDLKRSITTLCVFSVILLFTQCEKEEMILKKVDQTASEEAQDIHAKKVTPSKPDGKIIEEYADITGAVSGSGCYVHGETPFTLTITNQFNHGELDEPGLNENGTHDESGTFDGIMRIMYSTKKHGENRIDFWYTDYEEVPKYIVIRQANPNTAWDLENRILTFSDAYALLAIRDGTGETFWEGTASATIEFSDCD